MNKKTVIEQLSLEPKGTLNDKAKRLFLMLNLAGEHFGSKTVSLVGTLSIGPYSVLTMENKEKQVSYVYKEDQFLGFSTAKPGSITLPSCKQGLYETHIPRQGNWVVNDYSETASYLGHRFEKAV